MTVEFTGCPVVVVNDMAELELVVPTTQASKPWRTAFDDALPTRRGLHHRIHVTSDGIHCAVRNDDELDECLKTIERAVAQANGWIDRQETRARILSARLDGWTSHTSRSTCSSTR
jgi:hypothetical protein